MAPIWPKGSNKRIKIIVMPSLQYMGIYRGAMVDFVALTSILMRLLRDGRCNAIN